MRIDKNNIEEYFARYNDRVFAIGFNYFKSAHDADDVVQETFVKLLKSDIDFESEEHVRNWIIRVAVNECKRVTLSSWFKKKESLEDYKDTLFFKEPEEENLFEVVMKLPLKYRRVLHLFYYEGYQVKEIAEILGQSESSVTTQLSRARSKLRLELQEA